MTPQIQQGFWYAARSLAFTLGSTFIVTALGIVGANLLGCENAKTPFLQCHIDFDNIWYAGVIAAFAALGRFIQGYLAPPPPPK